MEAIGLPAGHGKTRMLIERCAAEGGVMVVRNQGDAHKVAMRAAAMGLDIRFPLTHHELISGEAHGVPGPLWIDDVHELLRRLADCREVGAFAFHVMPGEDLEERLRAIAPQVTEASLARLEQAHQRVATAENLLERVRDELSKDK